jgi:hypothetical protein
MAGAAYWASRQPGGIKGTWDRLQQGFRDIQAGQDPMAVGKRFISGGTEEPAGVYTQEPDMTTSAGGYQEPYRDYVSP